ncbi:MAG TPA: M1 family metallopeptidase [Thermomonas sp.]|jgi:aminopeptidase N|uniref:M1 family metallopeptidase n=1 Tax=Thermomonas sp. TaxID=1971895 RepID=UPI002B5FF781|nr:M1 family metallopeptidase [Thermomonas sp.]HOV95182.1 M1 family metallopeptidase [Thermomonas sp.]
MRQLLLSVSIAAALGVLASGCQGNQAAPVANQAHPASAKATAEKIVDEHSYAQPDKVRITDIALDLAVNFDAKTLSGSATYTLNWVDKAATQLVLDTRDLTISKAEGLAADGTWSELKFALSDKDKVLGSALTIETPTRPAKVRVSYVTSPEASGLQWLAPSMTEGGKQPFMFSQSQQIHARSWVPLQDTPQVRFTYSAHVTAPKDAMVLMSADNDPNAVRDGDYSFKMPQKIPSYLLAIAAGDLVFKPISARSGVWAEPTMVNKAEHEFEDTEKMITTAEGLYGPYRWGRYDLLVLPPTFPYGGMENPRLTFATPTVIVGDKSLVSLVAHELAHSWSGNLVTFATDKDSWLNEGTTTYVQSRITEALYGRDMADMEEVIDRDELKQEFKTLDPKLQRLSLKPGTLADPDDQSSATVYVKGAWFLQFLEKRFGRDVFDPWLKSYFDHFSFQSITTQQFRDYLKTNLIDKHPNIVSMQEVDQWLYAPGIPADAPKVESGKFATVNAARIAWQGSEQLPNKAVTEAWSTQEWVHFLESMPATLKPAQLTQLDAAYHFTGTPNGEIAMRWYPLAERSGYTAAREEMGKFIERVGRRKLILPIYKALVATPDGLAFAEAAFAKAKPSSHPITAGSVQAILDAAKGKPSTPAPAPTASQPRVVGGPLKAPLVEDPARPPAHPAPASK